MEKVTGKTFSFRLKLLDELSLKKWRCVFHLSLSLCYLCLQRELITCPHHILVSYLLWAADKWEQRQVHECAVTAGGSSSFTFTREQIWYYLLLIHLSPCCYNFSFMYALFLLFALAAARVRVLVKKHRILTLLLFSSVFLTHFSFIFFFLFLPFSLKWRGGVKVHLFMAEHILSAFQAASSAWQGDAETT